jgi:hypothetical protein
MCKAFVGDDFEAFFFFGSPPKQNMSSLCRFAFEDYYLATQEVVSLCKYDFDDPNESTLD